MSRLIRLERDFVAFKGKPIEWQAVGSAAATAGNYPVIWFTSPWPAQITSVVVVFGTASASGTLQLKKASSGTSPSSGTNILTSTISLAGTANTPVSGVVDSVAGILSQGDSVGIFPGGTLTSLADFNITLLLDPLRPNP